jgi:hypothetical protein
LIFSPALEVRGLVYGGRPPGRFRLIRLDNVLCAFSDGESYHGEEIVRPIGVFGQ